MNKQYIIRLIIIIAVLILGCYLIKLITTEYKVIEPEHFEPTIESMEHMENVPAKGAPQPENMPANFYLRKNRFAAENIKNTNVLSTIAGTDADCPMDRSICYRQNDPSGCPWAVPYEPGANGVTGDLLWHYMEPRMILQNNCLDCNEYKSGQSYNVPVGLGDDLIPLNGTPVSTSAMISDEFMTPPFDERGLPDTLKGHTLSPPMGSGILPLEYDCVKKLVDDSSRCGCNGFGVDDYNFHM